MQAAAHPANVKYLYYVANPDGCGGTLFSSTDAKFERDVARYKAAVANNNGHVPSCKHKK
jgi:cell division protein YceG involved in septum cleavage